MRSDIFEKGMQKIGVFFDKSLKGEQINIWHELLKHLPDEVFENAVNYILRSNRFFPTPEDFLTYYREFEPRMWEDVKKEYGLPDWTPEQLKAKRARRDKLVTGFTDKKDINRIIEDKK